MLLSDSLTLGADKHPARPALVAAGQAYTYAALSERVMRLAAGLAENHEPGERVAVVARNRQEYVEAYFGVPAAGLVLTLINQRLHPREMAWIIGDASPSLLLVEAEYLASLLPLLDDLPCDRPELVVLGAEQPSPGYEALLAPTPLARPLAAEDDVAWIIYTSGTTGRPKGAMLSHRNLWASVSSWLAVAQPEHGSVCLMCFPLCHVAGYVVPRYFLQGSTLVLLGGFEPAAFCDAVETHGVTTTSLAPTMIEMLLRHLEIDDRRDLTSLRTIGYGGSSITPSLLRRAMSRFPHVGFTQGFGMTETSGNVAMMDEATHREAAARRPERLAAAGRPMPMVAVRVVDADGREVPAGTIGELLVRGEQTTVGYWRNPTATSEAYVDGWYRTGDLGFVDEERFVHVVDRRKDMIVSGGENVYSREVEDVLASHPAVREVAVIGVPDERWGEVVCAVVVVRDGEQVSAETLIAHCRAHLAGYKRPRRVHFVDVLPRNAGGKVLKRELRDELSS